ncbi:MAG TPA: RNA polymerase sigma factor [Candidatus Udaeobacter sp.]|nr:RNA polymerase sigma factor [Candidatus Udaeobacter sp.]
MLESLSYQPTVEAKGDRTQIWLAEILSTDTRQFILNTLRKNNSSLSEADAEDVTQQVIFKASEAIKKGQFKAESKLKTWLYTIIKREGLNFLRTRNVRPVATDFISPGNELPDTNLTDLETKIDEEARKAELKKMIVLANRILEKGQATAFRLHAEGLSYEQIAEQMGIVPGTAKSQVSKAVGYLRAMYDKKNKSV